MTAVPVTNLQTAYLNSITPQITLDAVLAGLIIQDNAVPIAANLFQVNDSTGAPLFIVDVDNVRGSDTASGELTLRGTSNADLGQVRFQAPIDIDDISAANALNAYAVQYNPAQSFVSFVGGGINVSPVIDFTGATFIWEAMRGAPFIRSGVAPGFSAFTLFNALPTLSSGSGLTFNPLQSICLNVGVAIENDFPGVRTTANNTAVSAAMQTRAGVALAIMTMTRVSGLQFAPKFSTVASSTVNLGTVTGLQCSNPAVALFQPGAGTETMTAYYGVDVAAISFGGNVSKAAIRSNIAAASNARFLSNIGTAESDFGTGDIHLNDNTWLKMGNTVAAADAVIGWTTVESGILFSTAFGLGGNPLYLVPSAADEWVFQQNSGGTLDIGIGFDVNAIVFGTTAPTPNSNNWFVQFAAPNQRQVQIGGEYSDVLWTAGGSIDVNGQTVSDLQAFKINSPAVILNGGTIDDISNLFVQSMPSFGATRTQALRVLGRERIDGAENRGSLEPAQITSNQNNYQLGQNNNGRTMNLLNTDADRNITGIDSSFGFAQDGDHIAIYNTGAFDITLTHQDTNSLAANRFLCPEGLPYVIHPQRVAWLWYDDTGVDRWRVQTTFGHLARTLHLSGEQFRKGATAPTDVTIGTTPTIEALLFDATGELASLYHSLPIDTDLTQDIILRLQFSLAVAETNGDTCDFTLDYTAPTLAGGAGIAKTSTQVTGQFTAVTGRLAIGDIYTMDITFSAGDATNPLASALGLAMEIHLTNTTGVGAINLLDGDLIYTALRS